MSEDTRVRQNYWADLVAAVACFLFEAVWYSIFLKQWLSGTGRTMEWLAGTGVNPLFQYGTAFISAAVMAAAISCVTQLTGPQTAYRGMRCATALWLGFVITTWATEYVFEVRPWSLLGINAGFWFIGMNLMGAIVGGWKKKAPAAVMQETRVAAKA
jgi:hypothetical protein